MKKYSIFFAFMLFIATSTLGRDAKVYSPYLQASPETMMRANLNMAMQQQHSTKDSSVLIALRKHPDYIFPKKVLLFSAIIPGAGEVYCKSYLKGALFFGIEVGAWAMYSIYHQKGADKEKEYEAYADEYWDEDKWRAWFTNLPEDQQNNFSHSLPDTKTQQYYEMIGKYNQFLAGWQDVKEEELTPSNLFTSTSALRDHYMDMRYDSNKMFKRAADGAYIAMFNHVLSAIDAAWTAKTHNKRIIKTKLRMETMRINYEDVPVLTLKIRW